MAGDWLKVEKATPEKPEVWAMAADLQIDADCVFGKLVKVWAWFDSHTTTGNAPGVTPSTIDRVAGNAGFAAAMEKVGWLAVDKNGVKLPRFGRHNGQTAKKRALNNRRVAAFRQRKSNAPSVTDACTREEKRREERTTPIPPSGAFLRFWTAWPPHERKQSQGKCWEVWRKRDLDQDAEAILSHVEVLKSGQSWREGYVPAPLVYLNQRRWEGAEAVNTTVRVDA